MTSPIQEPTAEQESQFHTYRTHRIPMFVHLIWLFFYVMAVYYVLTYLFPSMQTEFMPVPKERIQVAAPTK